MTVLMISSNHNDYDIKNWNKITSIYPINPYVFVFYFLDTLLFPNKPIHPRWADSHEQYELRTLDVIKCLSGKNNGKLLLSRNFNVTNLILDMSKKQFQLSLLGTQNFLHHPNVQQGNYTKDVNFELSLIQCFWKELQWFWLGTVAAASVPN